MLETLKDVVRTCGAICVEDAHVSGLDLIRQIAARMTVELGVKYALVGRPKPTDDRQIDTDSVVVDGQLVDNFTYGLGGTPCADVISGERVCVFPRDVAAEFPEDELLVEMGVESYAGTPLLTPDGRLLGLLVVMHDEPLTVDQDLLSTILEFVSARVAVEFLRHERNLEDARRTRESARNEKFKTIGQIAGGVAHDFNNLLGAIMGHAELLQIKMSNPGCADHLVAIKDSVNRGRDITSQLTDYARPSSASAAGCDAHEIIDEAIELLSATMRGISVHRNKLALRHNVVIDGHKLQQTIINLMLNARDAMQVGGCVSISTKDVPERDELLIEVADQGVGINESDLQRIFEPYFTTKGVEGTGLGLASAYGILTAVGGRIEAKSQRGAGTTFSIWLPVVDAGHDEPTDAGSGAHKPRVMVLEDEPHVLSYLVQRLPYDGFHVRGYSSIADARNAFSPDEVDILLTDLNFPRGTSRAFVEHVVSAAPTVKVVLMTGDVCHKDAIALHSSGACDLLAKPFAHDKLLALLGGAVDGRPL